MANKRIDTPTGTETVGHEWDGIEELNTPLPRWWLITFYLSILFAVGYVVVYPAIPLLDRGTAGVWGWTSRGALADELKTEGTRRASTVAALAATPIEQLPGSPELMRAAIAGGRAAFRVNCVQCHGAGAAGSTGYPNLNDDDWLWGGNLKEIEATITNGIRHPGNAETHASLMPSFGADAILKPAEISDVAALVRSLSGKQPRSSATARGEAIFAANCAVCHGAAGHGDRAFGAPNLADAIWLYGSKPAQVESSITRAHAGVMPAWQGRLDPVTIRMLAAYVHSLGGGEDFAPVPPAVPVLAGSDAQP